VVRWRIKIRRLELGLRQEDVAEQADLSLRRFQEYENAHIYFNPTLDMVLRFCKVLELEPEVLFRKPTDDEVKLSRKRISQRAFKK
jgi:transcriptional regulator with XRE-family HTH domain